MPRHDEEPEQAAPQLTDRTPEEPTAEQAVVSILLQHPGSFAIVAAMLEVADFYAFTYRILYETLGEMHAEGRPINEEMVRLALAQREQAAGTRSLDYAIGEIGRLVAKRYNLADLERYARLVKDAAVRRDLQRLGREMAYRANDRTATTSIIVADVVGELHRKLGKAESGLVTFDKVMKPVSREVEERSRAADHFRGLRTGSATLDGILQGYQPEQVYLYGAYSSVGKTAFALNTIRTDLEEHEDLQVIYYSLEMSQFAIGARFLAMETGIELGRIRAGLLTDEQFEDVARASSILGGYRKRMLLNTRRVSITNIAAECRAIASSYPAMRRMVVVDYIQLVRAKAKERPDLTLRGVAQDLLDLAKELYCPVLVFAQLNGDEMERPPDFRPWRRDLRDAKALADDARVVGLLSRPWVHRKKDPNYRECFVRLIIDKNSEGESSEDVDLHFVGAKQSIREEECPMGCLTHMEGPPFPTKAWKKKVKKAPSEVQIALARQGFEEEK